MDLETWRDVHEPWLERAGLVERTEGGRVATRKAMELYGAEAAPGARARVSPGVDEDEALEEAVPEFRIVS